jgi:diguanylate cyclase (GGDEF)-like protein
LIVADQIERRLRERAIPHPDSDVAPIITVSVGVASNVAGVTSASALVAAADRQLYAAKQGGRGRICADLSAPD